MGNFHCIPNSCAEVVYQPYETAKIRWRYGTEPWQEIIGADDYSTYSSYNLSANQRYKYVAASAIVREGIFEGWGQTYRSSASYQFNGIQDWYVGFRKMYRQLDGSAGFVVKYGYPPYDTFDHYGDALPPPGFRSIVPTIWVLSQGVLTSIGLPSTTGWSMSGWEPANLNGATTQCQFKVFKKGQVVHQETRSVCPQVEKIPCSLGDVRRSVKVNKFPYLQQIEVVPWAYVLRPSEAERDPLPIIDSKPIPSECLNIYNNLLLNDLIPVNDYITQICSSPGCPPPEYEVICDCQCKKCPNGTCGVPCGDFICCYNDDGVSVDRIDKYDYCEETT